MTTKRPLNGNMDKAYDYQYVTSMVRLRSKPNANSVSTITGNCVCGATEPPLIPSAPRLSGSIGVTSDRHGVRSRPSAQRGTEIRGDQQEVLELKAYVVNHGYILQGILGSYGVCKRPGTSQSILLPLEDSDLGCVGNWKTSGSCSSEPFHCDNFHLRSLDFAAQLESSL